MNDVKFEELPLKKVLKNNGYIRGPFGSALKKEDMILSGIPVYEQQHAIYNHRNFRYYISKEKYRDMIRFSVQPKDLIISCSGTIGSISIIEEKDPIGIINQALLILRCDEEKIVPEFLKYYLLSERGHRELIENSIGSAQVNIAKRSVIENIILRVPEFKQQVKIVSILSSFDEKIKNNVKSINELDIIINTIYNEFFSQRELFENYGEIKQVDRNNFHSSNVFNNILQIKDRNKDEKGYPVLSVVKEGEFKASEDVFTKQVYSKSIKNYKIVRRNQVAYNPARANIGSIAMLKDYDVGLVSPIYTVFEMKDTITPTFFYYYMKQPIFQEMIKHYAIGTTRQNFPFEAFKMFPMIVPPMEPQLKFEKIAKPIEQKIAKLKEENEVLAEIRDTLLPKLMSGELPVEVGEN